MADAVVDLLKRKLNALESAYGELKRRFDRADQNGLDTLTAQSLFVSPMLHGPYRNSVDGTHSMTFIVDYDDNIAYLYSAKLKFRLAAVRSNVSAASAAADGAHRHRFLAWASNGSSSSFNAFSGQQANISLVNQTPAWAQTNNHYHSYELYGGPATSVYKCRDASNNPQDFTVLFGTTAGDAYTYDASATHNHTMTMAYGIYEGSAPSTPGVTITINGTDRTTALGGAWNAGATVDITDYLRDGAKVPRRQDNTIVLTSTELIDLEVICRSLVTTRLVA